ncbi:MAG TPA: hypothetical protein DC049_07425, partial [Spirochaetia bacterium]|nr:hypothetical protein [Spirochaetia bacterium]
MNFKLKKIILLEKKGPAKIESRKTEAVTEKPGKQAIDISLKKEILLFQAGQDSIAKISSHTKTWIKDSDLTPKTELVARDNKEFVEISYTGKQGEAQSTIMVEDIIKAKAQEINYAEVKFNGLKILIDYDQDDFGKIFVGCFYSDKTTLNGIINLEKGLKEYTVSSGFRKDNYPPKWDLLYIVSMDNSLKYGGTTNVKYRLRQITLCYEIKKEQTAMPEDQKEIEVTITKARTVLEILPAPIIKLDGQLSDAEWQSVRQIDAYNYHLLNRSVANKDSPFNVRICYDNANLYIGSEAYFPSTPIAKTDRPDGDVYNDEAIEYFFSAQNNNENIIQLVINIKGMVFDYIREFDETAVSVKNKIDWNLNHRKALNYNNSKWIMELAVPLKELKIDLAMTRYMGFQIVQDYINRNDDKLTTLSWIKSDRFPDPNNFGILVFNNKSFGAGNITIKKIIRTIADGKADFALECSLENFTLGEYEAQKTIAAADHSLSTDNEKLEIKENKVAKTFKLNAVKNQSGNYTYYISIINKEKNRKVAALDFINKVEIKELTGKDNFCPKVKKTVWGEAAFNSTDAVYLWTSDNVSPRTLKTAEIFITKYYNYTGKKLQVKSSKNPAEEKGIIFLIQPNCIFNNKTEDLKEQGYCLKAAKDKILLCGYDEPGLYYAGTTLLQIMQNTMLDKINRLVPCVEILDWPDLKYRNCLLNHPWHLYSDKKVYKDPVTIQQLIDWTERFIVGNKINTFFLDISANVNYKRRPEFATPKKPYSLDDLKRLADFCRDNFIETGICWEIGGHANWWLLQYHPELREKGFVGVSDITKPEHDKIIKDCLLDIIEVMKPKYISPKSDEYWHVHNAEETPDELLGGKTRAQAFLDFHVDLNNWLKTKGIKMMIFPDMLSPYLNGKRFDLYKIIDQFPKDIIIAAWGDIKVDYFINKGFETWVISTGWRDSAYKEVKEKINSYGHGLYTFGQNSFIYEFLQHTRIVKMSSLYRSADYAWNIKNDSGESDYDLVESGKLGPVYKMFSVKPNPFAGEKIKIINLNNSYTHNLNQFLKKEWKNDLQLALPKGAAACGSIPVYLNGNDGNNCVIAAKNDASVNIDIKEKYSALIFLHTIFMVNEEYGKSIRADHWDWPWGYPAGNYIIHYK